MQNKEVIKENCSMDWVGMGSPLKTNPSRSVRSSSSGLWLHVMLWQDTDVSEAHAASIFWVMTPYSVVAGYRRFRGPCCPHLQGCNAV